MIVMSKVVPRIGGGYLSLRCKKVMCEVREEIMELFYG